MSLIFYSLLSIFITFILYIPFIKLLYKLKVQDTNTGNQKDAFGKATPIFDKLRQNKTGTPIGGGFLVVIVTAILFYFVCYLQKYDMKIAFTLCSFLVAFMAIGLIDDIKKTFKTSSGFFALSAKAKFALQLLTAAILTYVFLGAYFASQSILISIILFVVITLTIVFFSNAYNITDGVDGLAVGTLTIMLIPMLIISTFYVGSVPITLFLLVFIGALIAFQYFNVNPARLFMGDSGSLSFGAIFVVLLINLKVSYLIPVFGFIYICEAFSSLLQLIVEEQTLL